jgi:hypothetical protein
MNITTTISCLRSRPVANPLKGLVKKGRIVKVWKSDEIEGKKRLGSYCASHRLIYKVEPIVLLIRQLVEMCESSAAVQ